MRWASPLRVGPKSIASTPGRVHHFSSAAGTTISALNLSAIENALRPLLGTTQLGFSRIPVLALGNKDLDVEKIKSYEAGYNAILGRKAYLTIAIGCTGGRHRSVALVEELRRFLTGLGFIPTVVHRDLERE